MILLAINIPSWERFESFSSIIIELENDLNLLNKYHKNLIEINVFENNSSTAIEKKNLCHEISLRSEININFSINQTNIGADKNIQKCYGANKNSIFTWVLGDDDHVIFGSVPRIISCLIKYQDSLGLLILSDETYICNPMFKDSVFVSYEYFARLAMKHQPHLLIAHTLISCNIIRTSIFDDDESAYVIDELNSRAGLSTNFAHMRSMIKKLLHYKSAYTVLMPSFISLDVSRRVPSDYPPLGAHITKIYYFYFLWLLVELGIHIDEVPRHRAMWWLFGKVEMSRLRRWSRKPYNIIRHRVIKLCGGESTLLI